MSGEKICVGIGQDWHLAKKKTFYEARIGKASKRSKAQKSTSRFAILELPMSSLPSGEEVVQVSLRKQGSMGCTSVLQSFSSPPVNLSALPILTSFAVESNDWVMIAGCKIPEDRTKNKLPASPWGLSVSLTKPPTPYAADVTFNEPFYHGPSGHSIAFFLVQASTDSTFSGSSPIAEIRVDHHQGPAIPTGKTGTFLGGLVGGQQMYFRVCSVNKEGQSPFVQTSFTCPQWPPGRVEGLTFQANASNPHNVDVIFAPPCEHGSQITEYLFTVASRPSGFDQHSFAEQTGCQSKPEGRISASAFSNGHLTLPFLFARELDYTISLTVHNAFGSGSSSLPIALTLPGCAPDPIKIISCESKPTGAEITFSARERSGGMDSPTTHLLFEIAPKEAEPLTVEIPWRNAQVVSRSEGTFKVVIDSLPTNTSFQVKVCAVNKHGKGQTVPLSFETKSSVPSPVTDIWQVSSTTSSLLIAWNPPSNTGGLSLTQYTVHWRTIDAESDLSDRVIVPASAPLETPINSDSEIGDNKNKEGGCRLNIEGLSPGSLVDVEIVAHNELGESEKAFPKRLESVGLPPSHAPIGVKMSPSSSASRSLDVALNSYDLHSGGRSAAVSHFRVRYTAWSDSLTHRGSSDAELKEKARSVAETLIRSVRPLRHNSFTTPKDVDIPIFVQPDGSLKAELPKLPPWTKIFAIVACVNKFGAGPWIDGVVSATTHPTVPRLAPLLTVTSVGWGLPYAPPSGTPAASGNLNKQDVVMVSWKQPDAVASKAKLAGIEFSWRASGLSGGPERTGVVTVPASQGLAMISIHTAPGDPDLTRILRTPSRTITIVARPIGFWGKSEDDDAMSASIVIKCDPSGVLNVTMDGNNPNVDHVHIMPEVWDNKAPAYLARFQSFGHQCSLTACRSAPSEHFVRRCSRCQSAFANGFACPKCAYFLCTLCASQEMCGDIQPGISIPTFDAHPMVLMDHHLPNTPCTICNRRHAWLFKCCQPSSYHGGTSGGVRDVCFKCFKSQLVKFAESQQELSAKKQAVILKWAEFAKTENDKLAETAAAVAHQGEIKDDSITVEVGSDDESPSVPIEWSSVKKISFNFNAPDAHACGGDFGIDFGGAEPRRSFDFGGENVLLDSEVHKPRSSTSSNKA